MKEPFTVSTINCQSEPKKVYIEGPINGAGYYGVYYDGRLVFDTTQEASRTCQWLNEAFNAGVKANQREIRKLLDL